MRNCVIWCVVLLAIAGTAYSEGPKPSEPGNARQERRAGGKTEGPPKELTVDLGGGVKMEFVLIPAGSFLMGDEEGDDDEKPVHTVRITKPFYLGKYEVTQEQWRAVMRYNPSEYQGPKNPVESVSWRICQDFLAKLNQKFGSGGVKFGLPTEAQWEYACRAGTTTRYSFGDDSAKLVDYAWLGWNAKGSTHPVGQKKPNAWGLYDMHGNVGEFCADWYSKDYYRNSPAEDPIGPHSGDYRVWRGGQFGDGAPVLFTCAGREEISEEQYQGGPKFGFRVARTLTP